MKPLTSEEMQELRGDIAHLGLPDNKLDELIHLLDNIIVSIIDQNSGRHSVQLSLAARANYSFKKTSIITRNDRHGSIEHLAEDADYAINVNHHHRKLEPD